MMLKNVRGSSIIENIVALGMLALVFFSLISAFKDIFFIESRTTQVVTEQQVLAMLIEAVKADPAAFEKNFSTSTDLEILTPENLPLGYKKDYFGKKQGCSNNTGACDKLIGYTLRPISNFQGLFRGMIRLHDVADQSDKYVYFLVNSN